MASRLKPLHKQAGYKTAALPARQGRQPPGKTGGVHLRTDHGVLKEAEAGAKTKEPCRKHGISEATLYNWKAKYSGMTVSEARRLKELPEIRRGPGRTLLAAPRAKRLMSTRSAAGRPEYLTSAGTYFFPSRLQRIANITTESQA
jgi:hypothetical protein